MAKKLRELGFDPDTLAPLGMAPSARAPLLKPIRELLPPAPQDPEKDRKDALSNLIRGTVETLRAQRHAIQASYTIPPGKPLSRFE